MTELDPRLLAALRHAPDHDIAPPGAVAAAIRQAAHAAARPVVAPASTRRWWRWADHPMPWGGAFAAVTAATVVALLWHDEEAPPAVAEREPQAVIVLRESAPAPAAAPAAATPAVTPQADTAGQAPGAAPARRRATADAAPAAAPALATAPEPPPAPPRPAPPPPAPPAPAPPPAAPPPAPPPAATDAAAPTLAEAPAAATAPPAARQAAATAAARRPDTAKTGLAVTVSTPPDAAWLRLRGAGDAAQAPQLVFVPDRTAGAAFAASAATPVPGAWRERLLRAADGRWRPATGEPAGEPQWTVQWLEGGRPLATLRLHGDVLWWTDATGRRWSAALDAVDAVELARP